MFGAVTTALPQRIAFVLVPRFSMIAFSSAVEALRLANRASGRTLYSWHLFTLTGAPEAASNGILLHPEGSLEQGADFSTVVLCSGIDGHKIQDRTLFAWLRRMDRKGADIGALCT